MRDYDFSERLAFSHDVTSSVPADLISSILPGCVTVSKSTVDLDRQGVDFVATLRRGADVNIDVKARERGCSKFWTSGPELALERWSVVPDPNTGHSGVSGWTLDEAKITDYTLHIFDKSDCGLCYLLPFQLLRVAFRNHCAEWHDMYRHAYQNSGRWRSQCVFVPAAVVVEAIRDEMTLAVLA